MSFLDVLLQCFTENLWVSWECSAKVMLLSLTLDVVSKMYFLKLVSKHCEGKKILVQGPVLVHTLFTNSLSVLSYLLIYSLKQQREQPAHYQKRSTLCIAT